MPINNLLDDVPTFVAVVESASFAAAGVRLNVSRSAVGKAIGRLEQRLGSRLFQRTTRRQSLTKEGHVFFEHCQRAMAEVGAAKAMIDAGHVSVRGTLRVSMPVLMGRLLVAPVLSTLAQSHPDLSVELEFSDHYVDALAQGYDLCVRTNVHQDIAGLMTRRIGSEATVVCASPDYLARKGTPVDLAALESHDKIAYARSGRTQIWKFPTTKGRTTDLLPSSRFHLDDLGSIQDFALAGYGLAWLPDWLINEHLRSGRLVRLLPNIAPLTSSIYIVWPETPHLSRRVRVAIDALVESMEQTRA